MREKDKFLQVRMTVGELDLVKRVAGDYGLDVSTFVRGAVEYFDQKRPDIIVIERRVVASGLARKGEYDGKA